MFIGSGEAQDAGAIHELDEGVEVQLAQFSRDLALAYCILAQIPAEARLVGLNHHRERTLLPIHRLLLYYFSSNIQDSAR
jgi:hypothetical protein